MGIRQLPDDQGYHAWKTLEDDQGQEVTFNGYGADRGKALLELDKALATGFKAFPGLKTPKAPDSQHLQGKWDYAEPQKAPAPCITIIERPDGRSTRRDMDWNDRDARRRFLRKVSEILETGGQARIVSDVVVVEGVV